MWSKNLQVSTIGPRLSPRPLCYLQLKDKLPCVCVCVCACVCVSQWPDRVVTIWPVCPRATGPYFPRRLLSHCPRRLRSHTHLRRRHANVRVCVSIQAPHWRAISESSWHARARRRVAGGGGVHRAQYTVHSAQCTVHTAHTVHTFHLFLFFQCKGAPPPDMGMSMRQWEGWEGSCSHVRHTSLSP